MKSSNNKTLHIQTTEMGIPLHGIVRREPAQRRLLVELDAPFSNIPPAQRLSAICKSCRGMPNAPDPDALRALFRTIIQIHQDPDAAASVIKEYRRRRAALEDQRTALRQRKRQVIREIKAGKGDCAEKHKTISRIANENGKLKKKIRRVAAECFREAVPLSVLVTVIVIVTKSVPEFLLHALNFEVEVDGPDHIVQEKNDNQWQ